MEENMLLNHQNLTIRNAAPSDAEQLAAWWNDGKVMAHAGFPNGLGTTAAEIASSLANDTDDTLRRLIIEIDGQPAGETCFENMGNNVARIGIKICDFSKQEKGFGKKLLSMLISALFERGYAKIVLDTNLKNTRAQHVYESIGFKRVALLENAWRDQVGELQSFIDYELLPSDFVNYAE